VEGLAAARTIFAPECRDDAWKWARSRNGTMTPSPARAEIDGRKHRRAEMTKSARCSSAAVAAREATPREA